ncbi:MAG: hypothetical protein MUF54_15500 [Polyangiaceae bacterium]|jgi:hypothetical protein|nr:hypothetical protein [Polyangiaceae bacterium]
MSRSPEPENQPPGGQMLIYQEGGLKLQLRLDGQTAWLTQAAMASLYSVTENGRGAS